MVGLYKQELTFLEDTHEYFVGTTKYPSVTQWIKSHWPEFNTAACYGSAKACSREIDSWDENEEMLEKDFKYCIKLFKDNWQNEVKLRKPRETLKVTGAEVLDLWQLNSEEAADEGTRIHELIEKALLGEILLEDYCEEPLVVSAVNYTKNLVNKVGRRGTKLEPEARIYSKKIGLAGTIDLAIPTETGYVLVDWKTNQNLEKDGYKYGLTVATQDQKDAKLFLYTLQLSLYAYMIETAYKTPVTGLYIYHLHEDGCRPIEITYEKDLIIQMLKEDKRI